MSDIEEAAMVEWTGARYDDGPTVGVETWVDAPPETVWSAVVDVTAMPGQSPEIQSVEWLDAGPALGARFRGTSTHDALGRWETVSHVVEYSEPRVFAWAVQDPDEPTATWRFTLEPDGGGTRLRQWVRLGPGRSGLSLAIEQMPDKEQKIVFVRLREFETNMTGTVEAIKRRVENAAEQA